ncbi:hypothetical protein AGLY_003693 [Aphis glycines]|uniref:Uncharacterized protein n=1 Tax=Aphis glycines TaxID=307491 RepID=A0A6G0TZ28_APHGL|nr:hypothetical protein AGLY_003693 [Aphis glycines]
MNEHTFITINFNYYCFYLINFYIFNEQNFKHNMCQVLIFNINKLIKGLDCQYIHDEYSLNIELHLVSARDLSNYSEINLKNKIVKILIGAKFKLFHEYILIICLYFLNTHTFNNFYVFQFMICIFYNIHALRLFTGKINENLFRLENLSCSVGPYLKRNKITYSQKIILRQNPSKIYPNQQHLKVPLISVYLKLTQFFIINHHKLNINLDHIHEQLNNKDIVLNSVPLHTDKLHHILGLVDENMAYSCTNDLMQNLSLVVLFDNGNVRRSARKIDWSDPVHTCLSSVLMRGSKEKDVFVDNGSSMSSSPSYTNKLPLLLSLLSSELASLPQSELSFFDNLTEPTGDNSFVLLEIVVDPDLFVSSSLSACFCFSALISAIAANFSFIPSWPIGKLVPESCSLKAIIFVTSSTKQI